jgi:dTDP-4-dehydrorhamnose reductase
MILLLGCTGFLGSFVHKALIEDNIKVETCSRDDIDTEKGTLKFSDSLKDKVERSSIIINCIAVTNFAQCELNGTSRLINTALPIEIARQLQSHQYFIHISTDAFYYETHNRSDENSNILLCNEYAKQKLSAEVITELANAIVLRGSFVGVNPKGTGMVNYIIDSIKNEQEINGWDNVFTSATHTSALVDTIRQCIKLKTTGIFNFGITEAYSKHQFIADICNAIDPAIKINKISMKSDELDKNTHCGVSVDKIFAQIECQQINYKTLISTVVKDITQSLKQP